MVVGRSRRGYYRRWLGDIYMPNDVVHATLWYEDGRFSQSLYNLLQYHPIRVDDMEEITCKLCKRLLPKYFREMIDG